MLTLATTTSPTNIRDNRYTAVTKTQPIKVNTLVGLNRSKPHIDVLRATNAAQSIAITAKRTTRPETVVVSLPLRMTSITWKANEMQSRKERPDRLTKVLVIHAALSTSPIGRT